MQSNLFVREITEDEAEKLEVSCGFCEQRIRIRSLEEHVRIKHSKLMK